LFHPDESGRAGKTLFLDPARFWWTIRPAIEIARDRVPVEGPHLKVGKIVVDN
jgi:hypothetical protein